MPNPLIVGAVGKLFELVFGGIAGSVKQKREIKAEQAKAAHVLKQAVTQARIQRLADAATAEREWERLALEKSGWKDEVMMIVILLPMVLCFVPGMVDYVAAGFEAIDATVPEWWKLAFMATVAVSYGLRNFAGIAVSKWSKRREDKQ